MDCLGLYAYACVHQLCVTRHTPSSYNIVTGRQAGSEAWPPATIAWYCLISHDIAIQTIPAIWASMMNVVRMKMMWHAKLGKCKEITKTMKLINKWKKTSKTKWVITDFLTGACLWLNSNDSLGWVLNRGIACYWHEQCGSLTQSWCCLLVGLGSALTRACQRRLLTSPTPPFSNTQTEPIHLQTDNNITSATTVCKMTGKTTVPGNVGFIYQFTLQIRPLGAD